MICRSISGLTGNAFGGKGLAYRFAQSRVFIADCGPAWHYLSRGSTLPLCPGWPSQPDGEFIQDLERKRVPCLRANPSR